MSKSASPFVRPQAGVLAERLEEPRRFVIAVAGPRQVGKTTVVRQVTEASGPQQYLIKYVRVYQQEDAPQGK